MNEPITRIELKARRTIDYDGAEPVILQNHMGRRGETFRVATITEVLNLWHAAPGRGARYAYEVRMKGPIQTKSGRDHKARSGTALCNLRLDVSIGSIGIVPPAIQPHLVGVAALLQSLADTLSDARGALR